MKLPKREDALPPKQSMHGAAGLNKKDRVFPLTCMHSAYSVKREGDFVFKGIFKKYP